MPTTNGCLTNTAEQLILDYILNAGSFALPTCYLALWNASPTDTGAGGAEVDTPGSHGYDRIAIGTAGASKFGTAATHSITTTSDITFGPCVSVAWGTVSYWALMSAASGGTMYAYGDLTDATVSDGDSYKITSGNLTLTFATGAKWTDTVLNAILEHVVGKTLYTQPDPYIGLYIGDPLGAGAEVGAGVGYSRVQASPKMGSASGGSISNDTIISYGPDTTSNWGTIDYFSVHTLSSGGSVMGGALLTASKTVNVGDSAQFAASALTFTLD